MSSEVLLAALGFLILLGIIYTSCLVCLRAELQKECAGAGIS